MISNRLKTFLAKTMVFVFLSLFMFVSSAFKPDTNMAESTLSRQQNTKKKVTGIVLDDLGDPLPGATITIEGTTTGAISQADGSFSMEVNNTDVLKVSFLGYDEEKVSVTGKTVLSIRLKASTQSLDEVTVVAFAKQKKESVVSSVSVVRPSELKTPSSNLTTALGGRIAGLISYQRSGEPGKDNAEFFIRGVTTFGYTANPLILIDNVELTSYDLGKLQPDDIATFSIMKDASATALYGARGANGVILVTTKEGAEGPAKLNIRFENSFSMPNRKVDIVDPVTYMKLFNEAALTRNPDLGRKYSDAKIAATERGDNPYIYPANDWYGELFKDFTSNQRLNLNLSGGGNVARYYIAATVDNNNGVLKVDKLNNFNNNINVKNIQLRSNLNIKITQSTNLNMRITGNFEDYSGPLDGGDQLYKKAMASNPVEFPKYYLPNDEFAHTRHILFGNTADGTYMNPYADMVKGYKDYSKTVVIAQVELIQKLDFITPGLGLRVMGSTNRDSYFDVSRFYNPFYYNSTYYDRESGRYGLNELNPDGGSENLNYQEGDKLINTAYYLESTMDYNKTIAEKHALSGLLVFTMRQSLSANAGSLLKSLAHRNIGFAGRFTYSYDNRYFTEFNFGYNGTERFSKNERFGFFPSVGGGWIVSNETFWETLKPTVSLLKLKGTYGLVGNDAIGGSDDRFFYMSDVNLNNSGKQPWAFGNNLTNRPSGISINRYANDLITWETSGKVNLGIEISLFDKIEILADVFKEKRKNILQDRTSVPATMGLQSSLRANVGEASSKGYEISMTANHAFNKDFLVSVRFNFTHATSKYEVYEEPDRPHPWLSWVGKPISQITGYIAERLFIDDADVANSPSQGYFGRVMPGDIKYKDVNKDGVIDPLDIVPIGYPRHPNIMYGFGASILYKELDFSFFFQGAAQSSFYIDSQATAPFVNARTYDSDNFPADGNNAMLQVWADDYWSETNRNSYAQWPRLSTTIVNNNKPGSTWWLRDGTYMRLKSVELGYTLPKRMANKLGMDSFRIYLNGLNLLTFSKFKLWDPEMGGNGLGYPIQKVYNIGFNINF
jgi:TonB-linked SusC/RagA family outer membrane protein